MSIDVGFFANVQGQETPILLLTNERQSLIVFQLKISSLHTAQKKHLDLTHSVLKLDRD